MFKTPLTVRSHPWPEDALGPGAKGDGGPPLRAQGPGALGPPGRGWYLRPPTYG